MWGKGHVWCEGRSRMIQGNSVTLLWTRPLSFRLSSDRLFHTQSSFDLWHDPAAQIRARRWVQATWQSVTYLIVLLPERGNISPQKKDKNRCLKEDNAHISCFSAANEKNLADKRRIQSGFILETLVIEPTRTRSVWFNHWVELCPMRFVMGWLCSRQAVVLSNIL